MDVERSLHRRWPWGYGVRSWSCYCQCSTIHFKSSTAHERYNLIIKIPRIVIKINCIFSFLGTSMSAPHVCGAIALLISGLLKNKIDYSPYSIKRAVWNTATRLQHVDKFAQGNGLLNVEAAFENLVKYHDRSERDVRCECDARNIYS